MRNTQSQRDKVGTREGRKESAREKSAGRKGGPQHLWVLAECSDLNQGLVALVLMRAPRNLREELKDRGAACQLHLRGFVARPPLRDLKGVLVDS